MTLVITAACADYVVQVSDRRLTDLHTGQLMDDEANKALIVRAIDADFAASFTGLGIAPWLRTTLSESRSPTRGYQACLETVREAATKHWGTVAAQQGFTPPHAFVFAGFMHGAGNPVISLVTNVPDGDFKRAAVPRFEIVPLKLDFTCFYRADGMTKAIFADTEPTIRAALRKRKPHHEVGSLAVKELRRAAKRKTHARERIGQQCMSVFILKSGEMGCTYHPTHGVARTSTPDLIETGPGADPEEPYQFSIGDMKYGLIDLDSGQFVEAIQNRPSEVRLGDRLGGVLARDRRAARKQPKRRDST